MTCSWRWVVACCSPVRWLYEMSTSCKWTYACRRRMSVTPSPATARPRKACCVPLAHVPQLERPAMIIALSRFWGAGQHMQLSISFKRYETRTWYNQPGPRGKN